ncbi:MAG: ankyrin repeat domain-containing protein [Desulfarculaceae bacterium]|jgi:ankyrin repeat protein
MAILTNLKRSKIADYIRKNKCNIWKCKTIFCHIMLAPAVGGCGDTGSSTGRKAGSKSNALLMIAAFRGDIQGMEDAIAGGADINYQDNTGASGIGAGLSPLHQAAGNGYLDAVRLLVEKGAKLDVQDSRTFTPLISAVYDRHAAVVEYLLEHGATVPAGLLEKAKQLAKEYPHDSRDKIIELLMRR